MCSSTFPTARLQQGPIITRDVATQPLTRSPVVVQMAIRWLYKWLFNVVLECSYWCMHAFRHANECSFLFAWHSLCHTSDVRLCASSSTFFISRPFCLSFSRSSWVRSFFFILSSVVWWGSLSIYQSTCNFPFLPAFWDFLDFWLHFFPLFDFFNFQ